MTLRIVAELHPVACAKRSEIVLEPTGSPVTRCSFIIAASTACARASGIFALNLFTARTAIIVSSFEATCLRVAEKGARLEGVIIPERQYNHLRSHPQSPF